MTKTVKGLLIHYTNLQEKVKRPVLAIGYVRPPDPNPKTNLISEDFNENDKYKEEQI
jgi:hypothetical protein